MKKMLLCSAFLIAALVGLAGCHGHGGGGAAPVPAGKIYTISGMVSGLTGSGLVLRNNGGDDLAISTAGTFSFATTIAGGGSYSVSILADPEGQTCTITNAAGTVSGADVTNITVTCGIGYSIGGTFQQILLGTIVLQNNSGDDLALVSGAPFAFRRHLPDGMPYSVTVKTQPPNQTCSVQNGAGAVAGADVTGVTIHCDTIGHSLGGSVTGLTGSGLVLHNDYGNIDLGVDSNGPFSFPNAVAYGGSYNVTVKTPPPGEACTVGNGSGTMGNSDVTNISIACSASTYTVGGTSSGVTASVVLRNNGGDDLTVSANGGFAFATAVADGGAYSVTVRSSGPSQSCLITNGSGTVSGGNVTTVALSCSPVTPHFAYVPMENNKTVATYTIDGTTGALSQSAVSSAATGTFPSHITIDSSGKFAYVNHDGCSLVSAFTINNVTGALTEIAGSPYAEAGPTNVAIDPSGMYAYSGTGGKVAAYSINGLSGALQQIPGSPFTASGAVNMRFVTMHPTGNYLYAAETGAGKVYGFTIDGATGALATVPGSPVAAGANPRNMAMDPAGKFLYVSNEDSDTVSAYVIDSGTGALSSAATYTVQSSPQGMALEPAGKYLYVANNGSMNISIFAIDANTGALTESAGSPVSTSPTPPSSITVDSTGTYMYVSTGGFNKMHVFTINNGSLTKISGSPFSVPNGPNSLTIAP